MLRKPSATLVAACCLLAGNAGANYTIDLIWADTGTATLTVLQPTGQLRRLRGRLSVLRWCGSLSGSPFDRRGAGDGSAGDPRLGCG